MPNHLFTRDYFQRRGLNGLHPDYFPPKIIEEIATDSYNKSPLQSLFHSPKPGSPFQSFVVDGHRAYAEYSYSPDWKPFIPARGLDATFDDVKKKRSLYIDSCAVGPSFWSIDEKDAKYEMMSTPIAEAWHNTIKPLITNAISKRWTYEVLGAMIHSRYGGSVPWDSGESFGANGIMPRTGRVVFSRGNYVHQAGQNLRAYMLDESRLRAENACLPTLAFLDKMYKAATIGPAQYRIEPITWDVQADGFCSPRYAVLCGTSVIEAMRRDQNILNLLMNRDRIINPQNMIDITRNEKKVFTYRNMDIYEIDELDAPGASAGVIEGVGNVKMHACIFLGARAVACPIPSRDDLNIREVEDPRARTTSYLIEEVNGFKAQAFLDLATIDLATNAPQVGIPDLQRAEAGYLLGLCYAGA